MFKNLTGKEMSVLAIVFVVIWCSGYIAGGNYVKSDLAESYEREALYTVTSQQEVCAENFMEMTRMFSVAVYDIVNIKCPDLREQLSEVPGLEGLHQR